MARWPLILAVALSVSAAAAGEIKLQVSSAKATYNANAQPAVAIRFSAAEAEKLARFTAERVGRQIFIYQGDRLLMAPILRDAIRAGGLQIDGGVDISTATRIADVLASGQGALTIADEPR